MAALLPPVNRPLSPFHPAVPDCVVAARPDSAARATFAARFCTAHGIQRRDYSETMLRRCLYPHARWLARFLPHHHFTADRAFVAALAPLRQAQQFRAELRDLRDDPEGRGWLRRHLRLRLSVGAARREFTARLGG